MTVHSLQQLSELAAEKSSEKRRELLTKVTDLFFVSAESERQNSELALFADLVAQLLASAKLEVRQDYSQRIAQEPTAPRDVVMALALDDVSVASAVIQRSKALSDEDLVAVASDMTAGHRAAIAGRAQLSCHVTDTLINFGETEVLEVLAANVTAAISDSGFERMLDHAGTAGKLSDLLGRRSDLPAAVARQLMANLEGGTRAKVVHMARNLAAATAEPDTDSKGDRARRRLDIKARAAEAASHEVARDVFMRGVVKSERVPDVALALAELCDLPEQQAANALISVNAEPLALLAKSIGLRSETYGDLEVMRCARVRLPSPVRHVVMAAYAALDPDAARRAVRFLKVRSAVSKTQ